MCGIGLFSLQPNSKPYDRALLVKVLLASVAERGEDACGYAWQEPDGEINVKRGYKNTALFLPEVEVPTLIQDAIVHVRDHTKGHPGAVINNHPLRYQHIVGAHNGVIQNDDDLFGQYDAWRPEGSTVDSLAIFMLLAKLPSWKEVVSELIGSYNAMWYDQTNPGNIHILRGEGRPFWKGVADDLILFASTEEALYFIAEGLRIDLGITQVKPGTYLKINQGKVVEEQSFTPSPFKEGELHLYDPTTPHAIAARAHVLPLLAHILHPQSTTASLEE